MTLLSAVVLGTDIFALLHRALPCTGAFMLMCAQVKRVFVYSAVCSAAERESHNLMNGKSTRKTQSLKHYIIRHISEMEGDVLDMDADI